MVRTLAVGYAAGFTLHEHQHDEWDQLIYAQAGVMTVRTQRGTWVVPPLRAVWVPAGITHSIDMSGDVSMRTLYFRRRMARAMPRDCCVVEVSPLLRELILHVVAIGMLDRDRAQHARLLAVVLDQLRALPSVPVQLPLPRDRRALRVAQLLNDDPSDLRTLPSLAKQAGASARTVERLFQRETGLGFARWRQQLRLLQSLRLLAAGEPVISVALEVGYDSPSAFISMFRRALGTTPSRYYAH